MIEHALRRGGPLRHWGMMALLAFNAGCASYPQPIPLSRNHIQSTPQHEASGIPDPVRASVFVPPPKSSAKPQTYSVIVNEVPVKELLFALARDSGLNIDVYPTIRGVVTINAIDETLPAILDRIVKQLDDLRYEVDGKVIRIMPDTPYLRTYRINYVNIERETTLEATVDSGIAKTGAVGAGDASSGVNTLSTKIKSSSKSMFWDRLVKNVEQLLRDTDKQIKQDSVQMSAKEFSTQSLSGTATATGTGSAGFNLGAQGSSKAQGSGKSVANSQGSGAAGSGVQSVQSDAVTNQQKSLETGLQRYLFQERASVIANPETGMLAVRATSRQHHAMQEFLSGVLEVAERQVLIEATIVEVELSDGYQAGVDWSKLADAGALTQSMIGGKLGVAPNFTFTYQNKGSRVGNISATVKLLESFGDIKVLSSPKLMALNNQTAVLQAVDNQIYFTVKVTPAIPASASSPYIPPTYQTEPHSVAEGVVMTVTPQINGNGRVALTIRPTITRIIGYADDPNPELVKAGASNKVPILQVRTMESVLQVRSAQILVMGGLMQDKATKKRDGVPLLSRLMGVGDVFSYRDEVGKKSELVVFLKATVIDNGSATSFDEQDILSRYKHYLPEPLDFPLATP